MAFLRVEEKKSGTYLRIVESFKRNGVSRHRTLHSLGKLEDYPPEQLQRIASKLLALSGCRLEDIIKDDLKELRRVNYGYALVIKSLWKSLNLNEWLRKINYKRRIRFDWLSTLELMLAERINEPCSKLANYSHQNEYIGFNENQISLQHFYRTLDLLSEEQDSLKKHLFVTQQSIFSTSLDVVFYDVTTLYFESQREVEGNLAQKGYSKDGKSNKIQIVLGLLVDKLRNPITYHIYKGNTYEGQTIIDALIDLQKKYKIDDVIIVADSAMIDKDNRSFIEAQANIQYIIGDRIKNLPNTIIEQLLDSKKHKSLSKEDDVFTYSVVEYQNRKIICTYSQKRANKDRYEREKLISKAEGLLNNPSKIKQLKRRGAGRFIMQETKEKFVLDVNKIKSDQRWDGYKAISTTSNLLILIKKYTTYYFKSIPLIVNQTNMFR